MPITGDSDEFYRAAACNATHSTVTHEKAVCPSNAWTVTKRKIVLSHFLYLMKDRLS